MPCPNSDIFNRLLYLWSVVIMASHIIIRQQPSLSQTTWWAYGRSRHNNLEDWTRHCSISIVIIPNLQNIWLIILKKISNWNPAGYTANYSALFCDKRKGILGDQACSSQGTARKHSSENLLTREAFGTKAQPRPSRSQCPAGYI
jgi:hypothetical protein